MTDEERYERWWRWDGTWPPPPRILLFDHRWPKPLDTADRAPYVERYGWNGSVHNVGLGYRTRGIIEALHGLPSDEYLARDPMRPVESDDCYLEDDGGDVICTGACRAYGGAL